MNHSGRQAPVGVCLSIMAAPVFMWSYPALAKAFLDRLFCMKTSAGLKLAGKKAALIVSGGGDAFDGADLVVAGFMKFAGHNGMRHIGQGTAAPMEDGVVEPHMRAALAVPARPV